MDRVITAVTRLCAKPEFRIDASQRSRAYRRFWLSRLAEPRLIHVKAGHGAARILLDEPGEIQTAQSAAYILDTSHLACEAIAIAHTGL